jgi:hypothetical protein
MTFSIGHIQGGTNAGWRTTKVLARKDWVCPDCGKVLRYYWTHCPVDGTPRPEE